MADDIVAGQPATGVTRGSRLTSFFLVWMVIGFVVYGLYGYRRSRVGQEQRTGEPTHP